MMITARIYKEECVDVFNQDPVFRVVDHEDIRPRRGGAILKFRRFGIIPETTEHYNTYLEESECSGKDYVQVVSGTAGEKLRPYYVVMEPKEVGANCIYTVPNRILTTRVLFDGNGDEKGFTIVKHLLRSEQMRSGHTFLTTERVEIASGKAPEDILNTKYEFLSDAVNAAFEKANGEPGIYYALPKENLPPKSNMNHNSGEGNVGINSPFKVLAGTVGEDEE